MRTSVSCGRSRRAVTLRVVPAGVRAADRLRPRPQVYWRRYVTEGRAVAPLRARAGSARRCIEALGAGWTRLPDLPDDAYVLEADDTLLVCPWNLRIRVAEAALSARDGVPPVLADAFVPPVLAGLAQAVVDDWRSGARVLEHGVPRVHEQIATWGVPLRWFVFVDRRSGSCRCGPGRRVLRYRTEISKARRRAHRALSVLRKSVGDAPITEAVEEGARWLEEFHPRSMVELDYGGLVESALGRDAGARTTRPALVAAGLAALSRGEADAATAAYEKLVERWRAVQLLERCNCASVRRSAPNLSTLVIDASRTVIMSPNKVLSAS